MVNVVVAKDLIPANTSLDEMVDAGMFETKAIPREDLVEGAVTDLFQLRGQEVAYPIVAGEQIPVSRLKGELQAPGGVLGIPAGHQAVSIALEPQRTVSGFIRQGDHVVIYGTFTINRGQQQIVQTMTLVPDALVLTATDPTQQAANQGGLVTVALTPADAELVIFAQEQQHLWLTLLPPNEEGQPQRPVTSKEIR
jgi:Flp pilus assembly protein CpaB